MIRKLMAVAAALAAIPTTTVSLAALVWLSGCSPQQTGSPTNRSGDAPSVAANDTGLTSTGATTATSPAVAEPPAAEAAEPIGTYSSNYRRLKPPAAKPADTIPSHPIVEPSEPKRLNPVRVSPSTRGDGTNAPPDVAIRPADATADDPVAEPGAGATPDKNREDKAAPVAAAADPQDPPHAVGDPVTDGGKNGPALFQDWPRPKAVIVATGLQMGYIEPCGCSGKENQKGGLSRRQNMLKQLAAKGWPLVPVDVGGQVERFGKQAELKFQATCDALEKMHYEAISFGADDLRLPAEALTAVAVGQQPSPFISANVALFGFEQNLMPRFRVISVGGLKIGVTAVAGAGAQKSINNGELEFKPAAKGLAEVLPQLKAAHCDHLLLLAEANAKETAELAKAFPDFEFIVTSASAAEPPRQPALIPGTKTRLIEVGQKGMYANAIGFFDDATQPVRFQKIALDAHWGESNEMKQVMASYQEQLKQLGLAALGLTPPRRYPTGSATFVGSKACGECHTKAYAVWEKTPHAHALETLAKLDPPRNFDPQCLSCHVTGWDPQRFYPYKGGYSSLEKTPHLAGNGCENCHGPGSEHVAVENGNKAVTPAQQEALRAAMRIPLAIAENNCTHCHDGDNSINFDFKTYWPKVAHKGKD